MKVLVAVQSRHGATTEIAEEIGRVLRTDLPGAQVEVRVAAEVGDVGGYDAAVVGSAVYMGRWMKPVRHLVQESTDALHRIPVWLFSSGPVGTRPVPEDEPPDVVEMMRLSGAREHQVLAGRLDKSALSRTERAITTLVQAPDGDYRDWAAIGAWAHTMADALR